MENTVSYHEIRCITNVSRITHSASRPQKPEVHKTTWWNLNFRYNLTRMLCIMFSLEYIILHQGTLFFVTGNNETCRRNHVISLTQKQFQSERKQFYMPANCIHAWNKSLFKCETVFSDSLCHAVIKNVNKLRITRPQEKKKAEETVAGNWSFINKL